MIERVRQAMRRVGSRTDALCSCPVCGEQVRAGDARVRAWHGKYAHGRCASYKRGGGHSQRVHRVFTET